jgi:uncharacterized protein YacL (UPF0231 family)
MTRGLQTLRCPMFRDPLRRPAPKSKAIRRSALAIEGLEDRTVLSATRTLGGLEFITPGVFTTVGSQVQATGSVQVGVAPTNGAAFVPLVRFSQGVSFVDGDPTGHFTGRGDVTGIIGGKSILLAGAADRDLTAPGLLNGGLGFGSGKSLSVAGTEFHLTGIDFDAGAVKLQGDITVPALAGLQAAVTGNDYVVIDSGGVRLTGLDVGISNVSFERAGFGFHLNSAHVHYSPADGAFNLTGDGSINIAGREVAIALDGDGLVIEKNQVTDINATVTAPTMKIGPAVLQSAGLGLEYSRAADTFALHGSAGLDVGGMHLNVDLGSVELEHGKLTHLDAAIDGNFKVMGITVDAEHLGLSYDAADDRFALFGGAFVSTPGGVMNHVGARFGTGAEDPGIVVWQGKVQEVNIGIDGTIKVGTMSLSAKDLTLRYDVPSGQLQLVGGLGLSLANGRIQAAATLTGNGFTINTKTGQAQLNGVKFEADADLGAVQVHGLDIEYTKDAYGSKWYGTGQVQIAPGIEVGGTFEIFNGKLTRIGVSYDKGTGLGIPIGDTGLYLTRVGGDIQNLESPTNIKTAIDATVTFGRTVTFMGTEYSLFQAHGTVTATKDELKLDGQISMCNGYMGSGTANVDLNWARKEYTVGYDVAMYYGTFRRQGTMNLSGGAFSMDGKVTLQAPTAIQGQLKSFGLPTEYAGADFRLRLDSSTTGSKSYAEASFTAPGGFRVNVKYDFDNRLSLDVFSGAVRALYKTVDAAGKAFTAAYNSAGQAITKVYEQAGQVITNTYDAAGKLAQQVVDDGSRVVTNAYADGVRYMRNVEETVMVAFGSAKVPFRKATTTVYDAAGGVFSKTTEFATMAGQTLERITDTGVRKVTELINSAGKVTKRITEEAGKTFTDTLDDAGNVLKRTSGKVADFFTSLI